MWLELSATAGATFVIVFVARAAAPRRHPNALLPMEQRFESLDALCEGLAGPRPERVLRDGGVRYQRHKGHMPGLGRGRRFPRRLRDAWHAADGEHYYVDGEGRPAAAFSLLPHSQGKGVRHRPIQLRVGRWGDRSGQGDYDGGHLIGAQLGGYGRWANLVPQEASFNRGIWRECENAVAAVVAHGSFPRRSRRLGYYVRVVYRDEDPIPEALGLLLSDMHRAEAGWVVRRSCYIEFKNRARGGSYLRRWLARNWLRDFLLGR